MTGRNMEWVSWSLEGKRDHWDSAEGWHSEHSDVYRRAVMPGRSVKVKKF